MRRIVLGALSSLVLVATVFVGGALAHTFVASTTLTINKVPTGKVAHGSTVAIYGKLKSDHKICRVDQVVKLIKVRPGADAVKAKDRTDSEGEYVFVFTAKKDMTLYTKFFKFVESSYGHSHTCKADRSNNIKINVK